MNTITNTTGKTKIEHFLNMKLGEDGAIFCAQSNYKPLREINFHYSCFTNSTIPSLSTVAIWKLKPKNK